MENIRGKSLKEWKEGSDKDKHNIPMRTKKYIVCLEERIEQLLIQRVVKSFYCYDETVQIAEETGDEITKCNTQCQKCKQ